MSIKRPSFRGLGTVIPGPQDRHSGVMRSIEPGISIFRFIADAMPRNDSLFYVATALYGLWLRFAASGP